MWIARRPIPIAATDPLLDNNAVVIRNTSAVALDVTVTSDNQGVHGGTAVPANWVGPFITVPIPGGVTASTIVAKTTGGYWDAPSTWLLPSGAAANRVPNSSDIVVIPGSPGLLRFARNVNTQLSVRTLMMLGPDTTANFTNRAILEIGGDDANTILPNVTATVVFQDGPVDNTNDPNGLWTGRHVMGTATIYGAPKTSRVRLNHDVAASDTSLISLVSLSGSGWLGNDTLYLPDTRAVADFTGYVSQSEFPVLSSAVGTTITLNAGLTNAHPAGLLDSGAVGTRQFDGEPLRPHVANLTRNVVFKSVNGLAQSRRPIHMYHYKCLADVNSALFLYPGRAVYSSAGQPFTNAGQFGVVFNGVVGVLKDGYQFQFINNVIDGGNPLNVTDLTTAPAWMLTLMNSSNYGLVQDNVIVRSACAGIAIGDGNGTTESSWGNVFDGNFIGEVQGDGYRLDEKGTAGDGFWARCVSNNYTHNVCTNYRTALYLGVSNIIYNYALAFNLDGAEPSQVTTTVKMPNFQGADISVAGQYTLVSANHIPMLTHTNNEGYGAVPSGFTSWYHNNWASNFWDPATVTESVVSHFTAWNYSGYGVFIYPSDFTTFKRITLVSSTPQIGIWGDDYQSDRVTIANGLFNINTTGVQTQAAGGNVNALTISSCSFTTTTSVNVRAIAKFAGDSLSIGPETITITNCIHANYGGGAFTSISVDYLYSHGAYDYGNIRNERSIHVNSHNNASGTGPSGQVYCPQQAPTQLTALDALPAPDGHNMYGAPTPTQHTNQFNHDNGHPYCYNALIPAGATATRSDIIAQPSADSTNQTGGAGAYVNAPNTIV